jgi:hypothetical protein
MKGVGLISSPSRAPEGTASEHAFLKMAIHSKFFFGAVETGSRVINASILIKGIATL